MRFHDFWCVFLPVETTLNISSSVNCVLRILALLVALTRELLAGPLLVVEPASMQLPPPL
ncbi:hypothetical protein BN1708_006740 [Verticillium longisporum]|uniref:Uncharacterized protein n=1 Tax=Verticillium longisporum TaxID=100787 RepID=A0A0G4MML3_VERLO|nr:hypothetical protein BN1708_006740 [Verticillium longisporum]